MTRARPGGEVTAAYCSLRAAVVDAGGGRLGRKRGGGVYWRAMQWTELSALEKPAADEGLTVSIDAPVPEIVAEIQRGLDLRWRQELRFRELP
jgi:hypothetical protein